MKIVLLEEKDRSETIPIGAICSSRFYLSEDRFNNIVMFHYMSRGTGFYWCPVVLNSANSSKHTSQHSTSLTECLQSFVGRELQHGFRAVIREFHTNIEALQWAIHNVRS